MSNARTYTDPASGCTYHEAPRFSYVEDPGYVEDDEIYISDLECPSCSSVYVTCDATYMGVIVSCSCGYELTVKLDMSLDDDLGDIERAVREAVADDAQYYDDSDDDEAAA